MERERINNENNSRIIQQMNNLGGAYMVDNRSDKNQNYLSDSPLQRISDEEVETLQGRFDAPVQRVEEEDDTLQSKFESPVQKVSDEDEDLIQGKFDKPVHKKNETGMPDNLKAGIESLSGFSMDDVRVHYNSSKPATVQALAYTQGTDIHVAPGQEKCLPHEAWHVAQQMAGRVSPTTNINGMPVNDNATLENEADVMGEKAVQMKSFGKEHMHGAKNHSVIQNYIGHSHNFKNAVMQRVEIRVDGGGDKKFIKLINEALLSISNEFYVKKIREADYFDAKCNDKYWGDICIHKGDESAFENGDTYNYCSRTFLSLLMNIEQCQSMQFGKTNTDHVGGNQTVASVLLHELGHVFQYYLKLKNKVCNDWLKNNNISYRLPFSLKVDLNRYPLLYDAIQNIHTDASRIKRSFLLYGIKEHLVNEILSGLKNKENKTEFVCALMIDAIGMGANNMCDDGDNLLMNEIPFNIDHSLGVRKQYLDVDGYNPQTTK